MISRWDVQRRERISAAAWVACLLLCGGAFGAEPSLAEPDPSKLEPPVDDAGKEAAAAFDRAMKAYEARDLTGALAAMRESYRLSGRTELLYNLARLEQELGACPEALADYPELVARNSLGHDTIEELGLE